MKPYLLIATLLLPSCAAALAADVRRHDFEDVSLWAPNRDRGHPPEFRTDTEFARHGAAMRIRYVNKTPTWGNLTGPCRVPRDALAVRFWLYKHSADPGAAMHIWLFEPDGDAWLQRWPSARARSRVLSSAGTRSACPSQPFASSRVDPAHGK